MAVLIAVHSVLRRPHEEWHVVVGVCFRVFLEKAHSLVPVDERVVNALVSFSAVPLGGHHFPLGVGKAHRLNQVNGTRAFA